MTRKEYTCIAYELREEGLTWQEVGDELGVGRKTAKRLHDEYKEGASQELTRIPERFRPLVVEGDAAITCDWHIPLHSPRMVNKLLEKASAHGVKHLVVGGDFFNMDSLSSYDDKQPEANFTREREEAKNCLDAALDVFDEVTISWGNHEHRILRLFRHQLSFEYCIRWLLEGLGEEKLSRVNITGLDYLIYKPGPVEIRIAHQKNFSSVPLSVGLKMANKYRMSVLTAHSHHFAQGVALDGKNLVFEGGGLFEPRLTEYVQRTTTHHNWVQGFYIWKDGICHSYSPIYRNI